jgi:hypothetical protein
MNFQSICEAENIAFQKERGFSHDELLQFLFWHAEISGCLISNPFLFGNVWPSPCAFLLKFRIKNHGKTSVAF